MANRAAKYLKYSTNAHLKHVQASSVMGDLELEAAQASHRIAKSLDEAKKILQSCKSLDQNELWHSLIRNESFSQIAPKRPILFSPPFIDWIASLFHMNWPSQRRWKQDTDSWTKKRDEFLAKIESHNDHIKEIQKKYAEGDPASIEYFNTIVVNARDFSIKFAKHASVTYIPDDRRTIIEYFMPRIDSLPAHKNVKIVKTSRTLNYIPLTKTETRDLYDDVCFGISIRLLRDVCELDYLSYIDEICFNGYINAIDASNGHAITPCIFSVLVKKDQIMHLILEGVDVRRGFVQNLKGLSVRPLCNMTPIMPIQRPMRKDPRFVEDRAIAADMQDGQNIAVMDWRDFEDFVRDLFSAYFSARGGEVKRTIASRDGGVDAIVHDPDPISGGEILIQAKRYLKTVPPSAVRELYGTVVTEGASKGLLVTTSSFGPGAIEAARGKPIELIDGSNLLALAEKYLGKRFRIELTEARRMKGNSWNPNASSEETNEE